MKFEADLQRRVYCLAAEERKKTVVNSSIAEVNLGFELLLLIFF